MNYFIEKINGNIYITGEMDDEKIALTRRNIIAFSLDHRGITCYTEFGPPMKIDVLEEDKVYLNNKEVHG